MVTTSIFILIAAIFILIHPKMAKNFFQKIKMKRAHGIAEKGVKRIKAFWKKAIAPFN